MADFFLMRSKITYIPDGAMVMPVDDYTIWLRCAEVTDTFGSLANVIADATTREILCNNLNALRYMVRSENVIMPAVLADSNWVAELDACAYAVSVPTMTSATTPSGTVTGSTLYAGMEVWHCFDKDADTFWHSVENPTYPLFSQYHATQSAYLYKVSVTAQVTYTTRLPKDVDVKVSSNGTDYTTVCTTSFSGTNLTQSIFMTSFISGDYWYLNIKNSNANYCTFSELQFYGLDLS